MFNLKGRVSLVTGASQGIDKGIVEELSAADATVYFTARNAGHFGRSADNIIPIKCDHRNDDEVEVAFQRIANEEGRLDILANNVWGGYEGMMEEGVFTWTRPFWQQPVWRWDAMFAAGVRAHYLASCLAARLMTAQKQGLIVNISFWAAQ